MGTKKTTHECDAALRAARRLHARGCHGIVNATAAWRDLTFTERLVWINLAGQLAKRGGAR